MSGTTGKVNVSVGSKANGKSIERKPVRGNSDIGTSIPQKNVSSKYFNSDAKYNGIINLASQPLSSHNKNLAVSSLSSDPVNSFNQVCDKIIKDLGNKNLDISASIFILEGLYRDEIVKDKAIFQKLAQVVEMSLKTGKTEVMVSVLRLISKIKVDGSAAICARYLTHDQHVSVKKAAI